MAFGRGRWTPRSVLAAIALVLFVVAAFGYDVSGVSLVPLGLAFLAASFLAP